jgi:hypothetical protein
MMSTAAGTFYRFHTQIVYVLVMMTLARYEFALGRRIGWAFKAHRLKVAPRRGDWREDGASPFRTGLSSTAIGRTL